MSCCCGGISGICPSCGSSICQGPGAGYCPCPSAVCITKGSPQSSVISGTSCAAPLPLAVAAGGRSSACTIGNISQLGNFLSGVTKVANAAGSVARTVKQIESPVQSVSPTTLLLVGVVVIGLVVVFGLGKRG